MRWAFWVTPWLPAAGPTSYAWPWTKGCRLKRWSSSLRYLEASCLRCLRPAAGLEPCLSPIRTHSPARPKSQNPIFLPPFITRQGTMVKGGKNDCQLLWFLWLLLESFQVVNIWQSISSFYKWWKRFFFCSNERHPTFDLLFQPPDPLPIGFPSFQDRPTRGSAGCSPFRQCSSPEVGLWWPDPASISHTAQVWKKKFVINNKLEWDDVATRRITNSE